VSLRWLGSEPCGWVTALVGMNRARSAEEFREGTLPWHVPTFNVVFADVEGRIGHQCVGRIPVRRVAERGYRPGWDPRHQWDGLLPFEAMPAQSDPRRGFVVTANNRLAPDDYPHPLFGTWSSGHRARRIREEIQSRPRWTPQESRNLQLDVRSGRALACIAPLVAMLDGDTDSRVSLALQFLRVWDCRLEPGTVAASLFDIFFVHWCRAVLAVRLPHNIVDFTLQAAGGLASSLLSADGAGWFAGETERRETVRAAFRAALDELTQRLGPEMHRWTWGRLHTLVQKHVLSGRGELGSLLDLSGQSAAGDATTVCSTTSDANHAASMGASYRMVADLADSRRGLWAISIPGASGHPGSAHYGDQIGQWAAGGYHYLSLDEPVESTTALVLEPS
jgi:penicillin amidase